jgi:hypothetical protein
VYDLADYKNGCQEERRLFSFSYGFWGTSGVLWCQDNSSSWEFYGLKEREMQQFSYPSNRVVISVVLLVNLLSLSNVE